MWLLHLELGIDLRNDKYSKKVFKYFVEYADKQAQKKTRTELERHSSTGQAFVLPKLNHLKWIHLDACSYSIPFPPFP